MTLLKIATNFHNVIRLLHKGVSLQNRVHLWFEHQSWKLLIVLIFWISRWIWGREVSEVVKTRYDFVSLTLDSGIEVGPKLIWSFFPCAIKIFKFDCNVHFKNTVGWSSVLSKLWSLSIIHQLTLFWFQLMYYWKWS